MRNIALFLKYNGTAYHGWQVQKNAVTVGETLEKAVQTVVGHRAHVTGCGRTDAGVHARCYVANFHTDARIPAERIPFALNSRLPEDIVVTSATDVPDGFNAIGSCVRKDYTYLIYNPRPVLCKSRMVLPQASGRKHHARGGEAFRRRA